nr:MAG TPA: hypothetical protein [Caudoviricetes sp.]
MLNQIEIFTTDVKRCLLLIIRKLFLFQLNNSISKGHCHQTIMPNRAV